MLKFTNAYEAADNTVEFAEKKKKKRFKIAWSLAIVECTLSGRKITACVSSNYSVSRYMQYIKDI